MSDHLIPIRLLPEVHSPDLAGREIVELPMIADDRRRVRRRLQAPDGTTFALELPTGTMLRPGQVLHLAERRAYVVGAAPEDVLAIYPRDAREAARVGHTIGNLHRDIDLEGEGVVVLWEATLHERLIRAGFSVERTRRPFHGGPPGEHGH